MKLKVEKDKQPATTEQVKAIHQLLDVVMDTIRDAGKEGVPSGHLYAALMVIGMSYQTYTEMVDTLVTVGKVRCRNHVLTIRRCPLCNQLPGECYPACTETWSNTR